MKSVKALLKESNRIDQARNSANGNTIDSKTRKVGTWKKEETARYRLEQLIKLTEEELEKLILNPETPLFERKIGEAIAAADWKVIDGILNQVYGKKTEIDLNAKHEVDLNVLKGFVIPTMDMTDITRDLAQYAEEHPDE